MRAGRSTIDIIPDFKRNPQDRRKNAGEAEVHDLVHNNGERNFSVKSNKSKSPIKSVHFSNTGSTFISYLKIVIEQYHK